ncbi:DUF6114 domain-containing protein [Streptomyces sp. B1866]|uniref:DUF6114 domain-containing protein n=1 Tax=Streptomyces sp. B1866 TaxID=3075431 RepID=UPI002892788E|nr:DUF6114 domain-containing protein [Streptomyces sp. B1866]MDT3399410.1 DUF6114 domain-containing protein [Streptomyces sp. B1866]
MSAKSPGPRDDVISRWRLTFRAWRWQRPFWAGLLTILAGLPIMYFPYANLTMGQLTIRMSTTAGSGSLIIGVLLIVLGLSMWFQPMVRVFAGVATIMLGLVSLVVSNFGGFFAGFLLALFGGGMGVAWAPGEAPAAQPAEHPGPGPEPPADEGGDGTAGPAPEPAATGGVALEQDATKGRHRAG